MADDEHSGKPLERTARDALPLKSKVDEAEHVDQHLEIKRKEDSSPARDWKDEIQFNDKSLECISLLLGMMNEFEKNVGWTPDFSSRRRQARDLFD